ncbi:hypothetical protein [Methylobacterium dankookense]|uniref:Uncharacterized protein n=1 Tax=Methylobacterium dankookense TaxID=560405 RepID=A0A564FUQ5_9HYPH|nr:hypothetical protein [Methylobacterium dankookense]GJD55320.1 hypothetical protein IFDJLNFL_1204 [Methylobacterium dankookense]VUF11594.1 hypothetical protein MTDSW087_01277 [Methylobacterium dankookense]
MRTTLVLAAALVALPGLALAQTAPGTATPGATRTAPGLDRSTTTDSPGSSTGTVNPPGRVGGSGNMGGGTGRSENTGVGLGNHGATQAPRQ